jgi:NADH-quinone oxidoreductase subunit E
MPEIECKASEPEIDFAFLDRVINEDFGNSRENLIMMMQAIQNRYRYLPRTALKYLSETANVPLTKIYEIATFYSSFCLTPKGKHIVCVCTGTACHLKGSDKLVDHIKSQKGIKPGQTTSDMKMTLETVNCLGACAVAPVIVIDEKYYPETTLSNVINFLDQLNAEE